MFAVRAFRRREPASWFCYPGEDNAAECRAGYPTRPRVGVRQALARGGRAVVGGSHSFREPFIEPIVLVDVPEDRRNVTFLRSRRRVIAGTSRCRACTDGRDVAATPMPM